MESKRKDEVGVTYFIIIIITILFNKESKLHVTCHLKPGILVRNCLPHHSLSLQTAIPSTGSCSDSVSPKPISSLKSPSWPFRLMRICCPARLRLAASAR